MNKPTSHTILQVERAASDLRRGQTVIYIDKSKKSFLLTAGEYAPDKTSITGGQHPAVKLMKLAGLLPQAVIKKMPKNTDSFLSVTQEAIEKYPAALAASLEKVSEAHVPLKFAENTRVIAFRSRFGHEEHLAVVIGEPKKQAAPVVRLHSSCVTGDLFGSLRCDCGGQLQKSLEIISKQKAGVILYLSQEGRAIGIANKLRAYNLQDNGLDTVEANEKLGFAPDERDFAIGAEMLKQLGLKRITLLTNNPEKIKALAAYGIEVVRREPIVTKTTVHNRHYLNTKATKLGHRLKE